MKLYTNVDRRGFLKTLAGGTAAVAALSPKKLYSQQGSQPNIVFFLVDDYGVMDLSCYGSEFMETPHMDALASQGMRFTQSYVAHPRCVPSRYASFTGKYPARAGVPGLNYDIHASDFILPEAFKEAGYSTFFCGKWHIGKEDTNTYPHQQGFDTNIAGGDIGSPSTYFWPYSVEGKNNNLPELVAGGQEGEYLTDRLTDETCNWITQNKDQPFFAVLSHYAVHGPLEAHEDLIQKYTIKKDTMTYTGERQIQEFNGAYTTQWQDNATFAAMVESVDQSLKKIMDTLEAHGIADNTIIVLSSDHGTKSTTDAQQSDHASSNRPFRAGKGWLYEGGVRVPTIVKWPGITAPGSVCDSIINNTDYYPTFLEMAGLPLRPYDHLDGQSFVPALQGQPYTRAGELYWHSPVGRPTSTGDENSSAIRDGDYKLIDWYDRGYTELFNINEDPGEHINLADTETAVAGALYTKLNNWRNRIDAYTQTSSFPPAEITDGFAGMDAPDYVFIEGSYTINLEYDAQDTRDLVVALHNRSNPDHIVGQTTTTVNAGKGTANINVNIAETLVPGEAYVWVAAMYPSGGTTPIDTMVRDTTATDGDLIAQFFAPPVVGPSDSVNVRVVTNSTEQRDVMVALINTQTWVRHGETRTTIPAGQNETDMTINVTGAPDEGIHYKWKIWLMPVGGSTSEATDVLNNVKVEVSSLPTVDDLLSISGPVTVTPTGTYSVEITYSATEDRDIKLAFNAHDGTWHGSVFVTVPAGTHTITQDLTIQGNPLPGTGFKWKALLYPVGLRGWTDKLDLITHEGITVEEEVPLVDELHSISGPVTIPSSGTVSVQVQYSATENRDIKISLLGDGISGWFGGGVFAVEAGNGTITKQISIKNNPTVGSQLKWRAILFPTGVKTLSERLDLIDQKGVIVE
jgi:arylsulfatase A-like enzyme